MCFSSLTWGDGKSAFIKRHKTSNFLCKYYMVIKDLRTGGFGRISLVRELATGVERICKVINIKNSAPHDIALARSEFQVLSSLDHPHIVKLYEYAEDTSTHEIIGILEYLPGGDCSELLQKYVLGEGQVAHIVHQTLLALRHCHLQNIVHRDIKPCNIVLSQEFAPSAVPSCKLVDFGFAARRDSPLCQKIGSPYYIAPEIIKQQDYLPSADIWSLGASTFTMLSGIAPFGTMEEHNGKTDPIEKKIKKYKSFDELNHRLEKGPSWIQRSPLAKEFLGCLLHPDPTKRPTAREALDHPWLRQLRMEASCLNNELVWSMSNYAATLPLVRSCVYLVAARMNVAQLKKLGDAFIGIDRDGDGKISRLDLIEGINNSDTKLNDIHADEFMIHADFEHKGWLSFTEFVAACIYSEFESVGDLAKISFMALDDDRDSFVQVSEVQRLLGNHKCLSLDELPQNEYLNLDQWCKYFPSYSVPGSVPQNLMETVYDVLDGFMERFVSDMFLKRLCCSKGGMGNVIVEEAC